MLRISRVLVGVFLAACIGTIARGAPTPLELRFEEGSGTIAHDSSGSGNDAQVYGATWVPTPFGTGLRFDGVDDYVDISVLENFSEVTIEALATTELTAADLPGDREIVSGVLAYDFGTRDGEFFVCFPADEGPFGLLSGVFPERNRLYHLAATFDGSTWNVYVDGELKNSHDSSYYFNWSRKYVGQYCELGPFNWAGTIDEVRIHTRALSAEEIRARYEEDVARRMPLFIRGHVNADAELDIADAIKMCSIMFAGEPTTCRDAIDANDDGELNLADVVCVLQEIFTWEHTMAEPYLTCGHDETEDTLDCASSPTCD